MKSAIREYWGLMVGLIAIFSLVIGFYTWNFHGSPISGKPEDWGSFGAYLSGTVGVAVVGATLLALMVTLLQQSKMLNQQEKIIQQHERQLDFTTGHNNKMAAYEQASRLFPVLLSSFRQRLNMPISEILESTKELEIKLEKIPYGIPVRDLFYSDSLQEDFLMSDQRFQFLFSNACLDPAFRLASFMANCIQSAPELSDYFEAELSDCRVVIYCALRYYHRFCKKDEAERIGMQLGICLKSGMYCYDVENYWGEVGRQHANELKRGARFS